MVIGERPLGEETDAKLSPSCKAHETLIQVSDNYLEDEPL